MQLASFRSILTRYKAVFLDSYGVLKNHMGLIPKVEETLQFIRDNNQYLCVLTNDASRSPDQLAANFQKNGLTGIEADEIISSGMMARQFLEYKIRKGGSVAYLGTENSAQYILQAKLRGVPVSQVKEEDDVQAMVFLDDEGFDWNTDINKTLNLLRTKNIPTIVANTDSIYPVSQNDVSLATGSIAKLVENIVNKRFIHFGKPDSQMFMHAFERMNKLASIDRSEILMVGDTLHTDILGGNKFGIDTALVLSGNTRKDKVNLLIRSSGIIPNYICESIVN